MVFKDRKYAMPNNNKLMTKINVNTLKILKYSAFSRVVKFGDHKINDKKNGFPTFLEVLCSG
jgi:hypothetical protein